MSAHSLILAVTLHARHAGHAVIDRFGFVPRGIGSWSLKRFHSVEARADALARLLARRIKQHGPLKVVLGVPRSGARAISTHLNAAREHLETHAIPFIERLHHEGVVLLLGARHSKPQRRLRDTIIREFLTGPDTKHIAPDPLEPLDKAAWYAAALALFELTHTHPELAFALYGAHLPLQGFLDAVRLAEALLHTAI